jgi:hypothetical protein
MVVLAATSPSLRQCMPPPAHALPATTTVGLRHARCRSGWKPTMRPRPPKSQHHL